MSALAVTICDLGLGNLRSVARAFEKCGASVSIVKEPHAIKNCGVLVVPGQGAFRDATLALDRGFGDVMTTHIRSGKPYLGICLGLQILFETSEESEGAPGLAIFEGAVTKISFADTNLEVPQLKVPHMGWNEARATRSSVFSAVDRDYVYYAHSYAAVPNDATVIAATTDYGGARVAGVARDNVIACQFHPEKSQRAGLAFLTAFCEMCAGSKSAS